MEKSHGIDISNNQGWIDWAALAGDLTPQGERRCQFVIAKCSEGQAFVDRWLPAYKAGCEAHKIPIGYYHFGRPSEGPPEPQADFFVGLANQIGWTKDTPFVLDIEDEDVAVGSDQGWWVEAFVDRVEALTGRVCVIYSYRWYCENHQFGKYPRLQRCKLWIAAVDGAIGPLPAPWTDVALWQYDWATEFDGIAMPVDADWCLEGGPETFLRLSDGDSAITPEEAIASGIPDPVTGHTVDPIFLAAYDFARDGRPLAGSALYSDGKVRQLFENSVMESNGRGEPRRGGLGQALAALIGKDARPDWPDVHPLI